MSCKIVNTTCLNLLKSLGDASIDGIITSPPYNITTKRKDMYYNNGYADYDNLTEEDYLNLRMSEFKEIDRVLTNKGVVCYNISYHHTNPILPMLLMNRIHNETNLTIADTISWKKTNSIPFQTSPTKLSRIVELIYIIVHKDRLHDFRTNKEVSKINEKTGQRFYKNYTNYIEAKNNDGFKSKLKASYSQDLCDKLINIYFPTMSTIVDPFLGVGTTMLSCIKNNMFFIGSEVDKELYEICIRRKDGIKK